MRLSGAGRLLHKEDSWYPFLLEDEFTQGHSAAGRIRSNEKTNNLIRIQTHDFPPCRIVPRTSTLSRDHKLLETGSFQFNINQNIKSRIGHTANSHVRVSKRSYPTPGPSKRTSTFNTDESKTVYCKPVLWRAYQACNVKWISLHHNNSCFSFNT
jgi:hypothetical protein